MVNKGKDSVPRCAIYPGTFDPPTVAHLAIADAARNRLMRQAIESVRAMTWMPLDQLISKVFSSAHEHHAQILQAIEDKDAEAAERAVVDHIQRAQRDLHRVVE